MTGIEPDVLLSRVLDGEATPEDWAAFRAMASQDAAIWRDLAEAQQDRAALNEVIASALAIADEVEAPVELHLSESLARRARTAMSYGGWLVAAVVALAVVFQPSFHTGAADSGVVAASLSPEQALREYFDRGAEQGRVLGEMPQPMVLQYAPTADGQGVEVVYVRQIVERAVVDDMYRYGTDDSGRPVPIRAELPSPGRWSY